MSIRNSPEGFNRSILKKFERSNPDLSPQLQQALTSVVKTAHDSLSRANKMLHNKHIVPPSKNYLTALVDDLKDRIYFSSDMLCSQSGIISIDDPSGTENNIALENNIANLPSIEEIYNALREILRGFFNDMNDEAIILLLNDVQFTSNYKLIELTYECYVDNSTLISKDVYLDPGQPFKIRSIIHNHQLAFIVDFFGVVVWDSKVQKFEWVSDDDDGDILESS